jgi:hypothetical protein
LAPKVLMLGMMGNAQAAADAANLMLLLSAGRGEKPGRNRGPVTMSLRPP